MNYELLEAFKMLTYVDYAFIAIFTCVGTLIFLCGYLYAKEKYEPSKKPVVRKKRKYKRKKKVSKKKVNKRRKK